MSRLTTTLATTLYAVICCFIALLAAKLASGQNPATCKVFARRVGSSDIGSGVLIAHGSRTEHSLVATAAHVVRDGGKYSVQFHGTTEEIPCKLVGYDDAHDVALLAGNAPRSIVPAMVSRSAPVGQIARREGYPRAGPIRVVRAAISRVAGRYQGSQRPLVVFNHAAISGESGGPVYDSQGRVVALCTTSDGAASSGPSGESILAIMPDESWTKLATTRYT